jgi:hypothetical protein
VIETYLLVSMALPWRCNPPTLIGRRAAHGLSKTFRHSFESQYPRRQPRRFGRVTLPDGFAMTRLLADRHNLDVKCRFLRVATSFQLPLFNFYERISSMPT